MLFSLSQHELALILGVGVLVLGWPVLQWLLARHGGRR